MVNDKSNVKKKNYPKLKIITHVSISIFKIQQAVIVQTKWFITLKQFEHFCSIHSA